MCEGRKKLEEGKEAEGRGEEETVQRRRKNDYDEGKKVEGMGRKVNGDSPFLTPVMTR